MANSAKVLGTGDVRRLISYVRRRRHGDRDHVMVLLSFKAGLRAGEIAGLDWEMVVGPDGRIGRHVHVANRIAKYDSGRRLPLNPDLRTALIRLHRIQGRPRQGAIIRSERGGHMTAKGVVNWFGKRYAELQMTGCSSHVGRRTFVTMAARLLARTGGSLRDVQELVGHRSLASTETYLRGDRQIQHRIVNLL